ncbi:DUF6779 domain-containing protein [Corynebacterium sp. 22KM0430]|uniref:DUF6779 domain-containing protein n=1 Tax=Corynebacterium sp. 22KM0430 TaxID=2989735 RepID=UPI0029C9D95D|nr:DUF6779 domain-containing protein [Corynebacterium sp. 22KM0430]WPF65859.1 hypothetical protein OLX12_09930 [Corynebacterium sp. 22KM0430]
MSTPQSDRNPEPTSRRAAHGANTRRHHGKAEGTGTDGGQVLLVVLVILALAASVVMQLTDSNAALKLALLAALWASIIGFFLVSRYRRQVQRSAEQLAYEQRLHRSELREAQARAEAAQSQRGAGENTAARGGLSEEDIALLSEIRAGIDEVRSQLEDLQGHVFEYEPAALRAQAWRLQELEESAVSVPEKTGHVSGAPSLDAVAGRLGHLEGRAEAARSISPELAHLLETGEDSYRGSHRAGAASMTEASTAGASAAAASAARGASEEYGEPARQGRHEAEPESSGSRESEAPAAQPVRPSVEDTAEINAVAEEPAPAPAASADQEASEDREALRSRGRRRADERSGGLSVAELMANMRRGEK